MDRPPKAIGVIVLTDGSTEKACEVLGVTPRTSAPSLDVRWSLAGVYVLRLQTMVLLAIPVDRVRGRDPTPWRCTNPAHAWRLWWGASLLSRKEKKRRCPPSTSPSPTMFVRLSLQAHVGSSLQTVGASTVVGYVRGTGTHE